MKLSFEELIDDRINVLTKKIDLLYTLKDTLDIGDNIIDFNIGSIEENENTNQKNNITYFEFLKERKGAFIYIFEIVNNDFIDTVKSCFCQYRKDMKEGGIKKRATSFLPKNFYKNTGKILYVGSIKKGIYKRVKEHLGFGSVSTGALNLKYWIPETIYLRIHLIPVENADLTYDIEAAVASKLKPLIGKTPD